MDTACETFPADDIIDPKSYLQAISSFQPGDAVTIFTPDDTHFTIALSCIEHGLHVLITKPVTQTLEHHRLLHEAAIRKNVLVAVEVHKRWDPMYADSRDKILSLGIYLSIYLSIILTINLTW
jgi:D-galacturonate reductase